MTDDIAARIAAVPFWYHKIDLGSGIVTPGWAPLLPAAYGVADRLDGQRVLDVGAWDGYWTFEALRRGAREVVAIDDFSDDLGSQEVPRPKWETFDIARDALGYTDKEVKRLEMDVYDVHEDELGTFDTVFFFGTLYHLRYPLLALDQLSAVCTGTMYIETAICDDYSPYDRSGRGHGNKMVAEFYPGTEYADNDTNWWVPTLQCVGGMMDAAGFQDIHTWKLTDSPRGLPECRGFAKGSKR